MAKERGEKRHQGHEAGLAGANRAGEQDALPEVDLKMGGLLFVLEEVGDEALQQVVVGGVDSEVGTEEMAAGFFQEVEIWSVVHGVPANFPAVGCIVVEKLFGFDCGEFLGQKPLRD